MSMITGGRHYSCRTKLQSFFKSIIHRNDNYLKLLLWMENVSFDKNQGFIFWVWIQFRSDRTSLKLIISNIIGGKLYYCRIFWEGEKRWSLKNRDSMKRHSLNPLWFCVFLVYAESEPQKHPLFSSFKTQTTFSLIQTEDVNDPSHS